MESEFYAVLVRHLGPDNSPLKIIEDDLRSCNDELQKAICKYVLKRVRGRILVTAALLGTTRETLRRRLNKYGIDSVDYGGRLDSRRFGSTLKGQQEDI